MRWTLSLSISLREYLAWIVIQHQVLEDVFLSQVQFQRVAKTHMHHLPVFCIGADNFGQGKLFGYVFKGLERGWIYTQFPQNQRK